jgi:catechol 2,3-dioxygenase-like lactoylglutathione lyase family enzyme
MTICGIEALTYGVEDVDTALRFFEDWGLEPVERGQRGGTLRLLDETRVDIRRRDDPSLPSALVGGSTVREIVWGVSTRGDLEAIGAELGRDRDIRQDQQGALHTRDEAGYRIGFALSTQRPVVASLPKSNTIGHHERQDARADGAFRRRIRQGRFIHVVLWVPRKQQEMRDFYMTRLGFKLTETVKGAGAFLRMPNSTDHHNLFLQTRGNNFGFQHVAFELRDIDEVMMCGQYMERQGWHTHLGPGRHFAGSNVYWYFDCAAGGLVETGCDMDCITDHWQPVEHETIPFEGSSWYVRPADAGLRPGHGEWPQYVE